MAKLFVTIDEEKDINIADKLTTWKDGDGFKFDVVNGSKILSRIDKDEDEVLKERLHSMMNEATAICILLGDKTKSFRKFTRWQIEYACECGKPVIVMNINGIRSVDFDRCPAYLKKHLSMHISFQNEILNFALEDWPDKYTKRFANEDKKCYRYSNDVYDSLGLATSDIA